MRKRAEVVVIALIGLLGGLWVYLGWPDKKADPIGRFRLVAEDGRPILIEADLVVYDWPTHTMLVRPGSGDSSPSK